jgi:pSer/pThr/pTyr-binding forkhead associated (FHA) protein
MIASPAIYRRADEPRERGSEMKLSLLVLNEGKASGQAVPVKLSQFIIGRDPQCQLRPASALISKRHCAILTKANKYLIRDFDSTNGTFLNDKPVKGERELKNDDILKVGPLTFRVSIELDTPPVNKPTPLPKALSQAPNEDESVAAMLLDLADESGANRDAEGVPGGTTIMDSVSPIPPEGTAGIDAAATMTNSTTETAAHKAAEKKSAASGNTSEAAQAILQKYMRRERK